MRCDTARVVACVRSGGQSGADRAALDVARKLGIPIRGFVPRGGWAEDFREPPGLLRVYPELEETSSADPSFRTRLNVRDSHATFILTSMDLMKSEGTLLTAEYAGQLGRPCLVAPVSEDPATIATWIRSLGRELTLNVAGPRESEEPGLYSACLKLLTAVLRDLQDRAG